MATTKIYGVSFGDGNNGVSQLFPSFYVKTDKPWTLARAAILSDFNRTTGKEWANRHLDLDGESDFTIYAILSNPPCETTPDGEYPELPEGEDSESAEDGRNYGDGGAWMICEVFPVAEKDIRDNVNQFDSIEEALDSESVALAQKEETE